MYTNSSKFNHVLHFLRWEKSCPCSALKQRVRRRQALGALSQGRRKMVWVWGSPRLPGFHRPAEKSSPPEGPLPQSPLALSWGSPLPRGCDGPALSPPAFRLVSLCPELSGDLHWKIHCPRGESSAWGAAAATGPLPSQHMPHSSYRMLGLCERAASRASAAAGCPCGPRSLFWHVSQMQTGLHRP